mmetsp:Transcript_8926/g.25712  ORF Transcript_8926/g.25712 Transcript_8926/m.25712 type:complete len:108 (-) Transcript_8926:77-400(-)
MSVCQSVSHRARTRKRDDGRDAHTDERRNAFISLTIDGDQSNKSLLYTTRTLAELCVRVTTSGGLCVCVSIPWWVFLSWRLIHEQIDGRTDAHAMPPSPLLVASCAV